MDTQDRRAHLGAFSPPSPWEGMASIEQLEQQLGQHLDVVEIFRAFGGPYGLCTPGALQQLETVTTSGRLPLVTLEPWAPGAGATQPAWSCSQVAAGSADAILTSWRDGLTQFDRPVVIRFAHEMNGNWYPWCVGVNKNRAKDYQNAFRRAASFLRLPNVSLMWAPNCVDVPNGNRLEDTFPGTDVVQLVGLSGYGRNGRSFADTFAPAVDRVRKLTNAPIWVAECGARIGQQEFIAAAMSNVVPEIDTVVLFNASGSDDWRITS